MRKNKTGFTLIELAIVLVVVGLLIGGVLVGQSLIDTAKINSEIKQIGQFDIAVSNFYSRYKQLPGDNSIIGDNGGHDGRIMAYSSSIMGYESAKFWYDLVTTGFDDSDFSTADLSASTGNLDSNIFPSSKINPDAEIYAFGATFNKNYYIYVDFSQWGSIPTFSTAAFRPIDIAPIDQKIDDANPYTGNVGGSNRVTMLEISDGLNFETITWSGGGTGGNCITSGQYNIALTSKACSMRVRIGSTTGRLF